MRALAARPWLLVLAMAAVGDSAGAPIAIVTGGNTGIGYYTAGQLASVGYAVVIGCRSVARGEAAAAALTEAGGDVINRQLDLSSFASVLKFAEAFWPDR
ncbi:DHRS13 [Symbiodinium sp. CCMP2592]|nr:DHRS13 [Symbiodinium sp. CCMP2592]